MPPNAARRPAVMLNNRDADCAYHSDPDVRVSHVIDAELCGTTNGRIPAARGRRSLVGGRKKKTLSTLRAAAPRRPACYLHASIPSPRPTLSTWQSAQAARGQKIRSSCGTIKFVLIIAMQIGQAQQTPSRVSVHRMPTNTRHAAVAGESPVTGAERRCPAQRRWLVRHRHDSHRIDLDLAIEDCSAR